jgi:predicted DNA-binding transcriptional regulator YafY
MTRPTARVLALLEILQAGGTRTVGDLAERLGVDERTVRRYVEHLIDLDIPVRSVRGRYGGYRLAPGFRMPPLMLTDDEAVAVLLGLGLSSAPATESAAAKVRRVLPEALGRRLDALIETTGFTGSRRPAETPETRLLLTLAEAARDRRPVALRYHGKERTLHPYGIVIHSGRWYVTGADSASGQVRTFRLDRIESAAVTGGTFEAPDEFDPASQVLSSLASMPRGHAVSVRIQGSEADVRRRLPGSVATVEELGAGWVRVRLQAERLDWVPGVLAGLDRPFVVEAPPQLADAVRDLGKRLIAYAATHEGSG